MRFLLGFIVILLLWGCLSEPDCISGKSSYVQFRMRDTLTKAVTFVKFSAIKVSGADSINFAPTDSVSSFSLPLNPLTRETSYTFDYFFFRDSARLDTLKRSEKFILTYAGQNTIVSTKCPPYILFFDLNVSSYSFSKKPLVLNRTLTTGTTVNVEIQFN